MLVEGYNSSFVQTRSSQFELLNPEEPSETFGGAYLVDCIQWIVSSGALESAIQTELEAIWRKLTRERTSRVSAKTWLHLELFRQLERDSRSSRTSRRVYRTVRSR